MGHDIRWVLEPFGREKRDDEEWQVRRTQRAILLLDFPCLHEPALRSQIPIHNDNLLSYAFFPNAIFNNQYIEIRSRTQYKTMVSC
jgi:hypothetical protein